MSDFVKGEGAKIAIKFTEHLIGDITENKAAFSINGKERKHVNGELIDGDYQIDKIERHPVQKLWEDDLGDGLQLDIEVPGAIGIEDIADTTLKSSSKYTKIANRVEFKKDTIIIQIKIKTSIAGDYTLYIKNDEDNSIVYEAITKTNLPADTWVTFDISPLHVLVGDRYKIEILQPLDSSYMVAGLHDGVLWKCIEGIFGDGAWSNYFAAMGFVEQNKPNKYFITKEYITIVNLPTSAYRIRYSSVKPVNTNIKIEITTGKTQGEWQEVSNGEVITANNNLWIKVTLTTTDETITPILKEIWLEEPEQRKDTILLTMKPLKRFNNVEGELTVSYDQTKGTLKGEGGSVESFEHSFLPTDLVPVPNPYSPERLIIKHRIEGNFIRIYYTRAYVNEKITAKPNLIVDFINVGEINP